VTWFQLTSLGELEYKRDMQDWWFISAIVKSLRHHWAVNPCKLRAAAIRHRLPLSLLAFLNRQHVNLRVDVPLCSQEDDATIGIRLELRFV